MASYATELVNFQEYRGAATGCGGLLAQSMVLDWRVLAVPVLLDWRMLAALWVPDVRSV